MWLSRLDLLAFGKFSDVHLPLGPGFHLVYGPNEAGKSTALRAIRQLLFGFDERTTDNFLHENPNLRVGGVVCRQPDLELAVIRRKARKDSLRADDDSTLIDTEKWNQLLLGIDETTFRQRYGIDYEQLVEGGRQIATGNGDLGEILFAAGSGVMDLNSIKRQLIDEAEEIFKPMGKKQRLNLAIEKWRELKDQVRDKLLTVSEWEEADRLRHETMVRLEEVSVELRKFTDERDRFRRWQLAWPIVAEMDALEQSRTPLDPVPSLSDDFGSKRHEAQRLFKQADSYETTANATIQNAKQKLDKLTEPSSLIGRAEQISKLITVWGYCQKGLDDREKLIGECHSHASAFDQRLLSIGRPLSELPDFSLVHDRDFRTRLSAMGRQHSKLSQSLKLAETNRDRITDQIKEARSLLATLPEITVNREFRNRLRAMQSEGDLESRLHKLREEISVVKEESLRQLERLGVGNMSLEAFQRMGIPGPETVKQLVSDFESNHEKRTLCAARLAELESEHDKIQQHIEILRHEFQVPTQADLEIARQKRNEKWLQIRKSCTLKSIPSDQLIHDFEVTLRNTDAIADRLRNEAERVAQLADELSDLEANQTSQHDLAVGMAELSSQRISLENRWRSEWPELNDNLPLVSEIQMWLLRRETVLQNNESTLRRENDAKSLRERINRHHSTLTELMGGELQNIALFANDSSAIERGSLKDCVRLADDYLKLSETAMQKRQNVIDQIDRLTQDCADNSQLELAARSELSAWHLEWSAAMLALRLPQDTSPDAATTFVEQLNELANLQDQIRRLQDRIAGIDADNHRFEADLRELCQDAAPDLIGAKTSDIMSTLRDRLQVSQSEAKSRNEHSTTKAQAEQQLLLSKESRLFAKQSIAELCEIARVVPNDSIEQTFQQLEAIEMQTLDRKRLDERLLRARLRIRELAGTESMDVFIHSVRIHSMESLASKVSELETIVRRLDKDRDQLNHQLGGVDNRLLQMNGAADAAEAEETRQQILAKIRTEAENYVQLKLASSILHASIERYREKIRGPVLLMAGDLFCELTLGSFESLRVDEDAKNNPVLVGVRPHRKQAVAVNAMSEGTCDQLYLALRLASLQLETAPRRDLPLIIDDILIQFDDKRAIAALKVLNRLSRQRQVLFFTHHQHLIKLANEHLDDDCHVHRLDA